MRDFSRQADLVPDPQNQSATVIGCGAIGRNVALQLASIGIGKLQLIDFDSVEETNVTTQGFLSSEIGQQKVSALADSVLRIDPTISIEQINDRWRPKQKLSDVVFCCVDSIETRALIWRAVKDKSRFFCDGRMLGEVIRILTVAAGNGTEHYPTTLFRVSEAHQGRCTAQSTIYAATIAAGLMLHQFSRFLRGLATDQDVMLSLLASEMTV